MPDNEFSQEVKDEFETLLQKHLSLFRDILANLHQETVILQYGSNNFGSGYTAEIRRHLLETLEKSNHAFKDGFNKVIDKNSAAEQVTSESTESFNFIGKIEELRSRVSENDCELILLCEQISRVFDEIHRAATKYLNSLEGQIFLQKNIQLKKIKPAVATVALSVMERGSETD